MSFQRKMQRNIWKHIGNKKGKRFFNRFPLIYANNEPKSVLARDLGDCRDNLRNSRREHPKVCVNLQTDVR